MSWQQNVAELENIRQEFRRYPRVDRMQGEVHVEKGTCHFYDLHPSDEFGRYSARLFENTPADDGPGKFGIHGHQQREWIIVVDGVMELEIVETGQIKRLEVGDYAVLEPGCEHDATFPVRCMYAVFTVPATDDW